MITVEAILTLVPFMMVILGIISFINVYMVHNKIQYAMHQMSAELSGYTYFYQALGIRGADLGLKQDIDNNTQKIDDTIEQFNGFLSQVGEFEKSVDNAKQSDYNNVMPNLEDVVDQGNNTFDKGKDLYNSGRELVSDPKTLMRELVYLGLEYGENEAKTLIAEGISKGLMNVYLDETFLESNNLDADAYLKHYGVKDGLAGLDFGESELFSDDNYRNIDIVVEYKVEIYILKLFLKDPTITVVQRCTSPAWLDGDGVQYSK